MSQHQAISTTGQQQASLVDQEMMSDQLQPQLRCYLCETPKREYSLIRTFSEIVCRGCLNYEGPDKVELLIAEARRFKRQQASPMGKTNSNYLKTTLPMVATSATTAQASNEHHMNGSNNKLNRNYMDLNQRMQLIANDEICILPLHHRANPIRQSIDRSSPINVESLAMNKGTVNCTNPNCDVDNQLSTASTGTSNSTGVAWTETNQNRPQQVKLTKAQSKAEKEKRAAVEFQSAHVEEYADYCPLPRRRKNDTSNQQQVKSNSTKPIRFEAVESPNLISKTEQQQISAAIKTTRSQVVSPNKQQSNQRQPDRTTVCPPAQTTTNTPPTSISGPHYVGQQMTQAGAYSHRPFAPMMSNPVNNFNPVEQYLPQRDMTNDYNQAARFLQKQRANSGQDALIQAQHYPQNPNTANSLALYAATDCANPPYYMRHPQAPPNQSTTSRLTNNRLTSSTKQHVPQAPPNNMYDHFPFAMGPYMTPSGLAAIYCSTQYHPYHSHHHPAAALSANSGCNPLLTPATYSSGQGTASAIGPGLGASVTCPSYINQSGDGCTEMRTIGDCGSPPNDKIQQQAPELNLRRLLSCNTNFDPKGNAPDNFGDNSLMISRSSQKAVNESPVSPPSSQQQTQLKNTQQNDDEVFVEKVQQCHNRKFGEKTSKIADDKIIDENNNSGDGSLIILDKSSSQSCDSNKKDCNDDERSNQGVQFNINGTLGPKTNDSLSRENEDDNEITIESDLSLQRDDFAYSLNSNSPQSPVQSKRPNLGFTLNRNMSGSNMKISSQPATNGHKASKYQNFDNSSLLSPPSPPSPSIGAASTRSQHAAASRSQGQATSNDPSDQQRSGKDHMNEIELRSKHGHDSPMVQHKNDNSTKSSGQLSPKSADDKQHRTGLHRQTNAPSLLSTPTSPATTTSQLSTARHQSNGIEKAHHQARSESSAGHQARCSNDSTTSANNQQAKEPVKTHQYNPLKCMACKERLEDRHFVQCPSISAHKFCFACSKRSIEAQQLENKSAKSAHDGIFCPSGSRCFLATEPTPWTFMNSEIETIFRESSRQASSLQRPNTTNKSNGTTTGELDYIAQSNGNQVSGRSSQKLKDLMQSFNDNGGNGGQVGKASKKHSSRGLASETSSSSPQKSYHGSSNKSAAGGGGVESAAQASKVA